MITILQISDPHLMSDRSRPLKGVPTAKTLTAVLAESRHRYPDCSRVIWTGDLSHQHSVQGYQLLRELAGNWVDRSLFIPGNHDDRSALRSVFPTANGEDHQAVLFRAHLDDWQLIGLDSHLVGETAGVLSKDQLSQLDCWLSEEPERLTLLFIHHPPAPVESRWIDSIGLCNPEPLAELIQQRPGVCAIFSGHVHQVYQGQFAGVPFYTAPSTAFQFQAKSNRCLFELIPPGFRVIHLRAGNLSTTVVRLRELGHPPQG